MLPRIQTIIIIMLMFIISIKWLKQLIKYIITIIIVDIKEFLATNTILNIIIHTSKDPILIKIQPLLHCWDWDLWLHLAAAPMLDWQLQAQITIMKVIRQIQRPITCQAQLWKSNQVTNFEPKYLVTLQKSKSKQKFSWLAFDKSDFFGLSHGSREMGTRR